MFWTGASLARIGEEERAISYLDQAISLGGEEHWGTAFALNSLAQIYNSKGHYADAEPLYRRGLAILEKVFGPNHPSTGMALNNLAGNYKNQSR
ncbi:MAG: tetratricopeptide repeat protein, partial [Gammaproteobacteria bacterium]|nr:tetratricopeptide repeat protein [Gammaproteobacteria bacterium]